MEIIQVVSDSKSISIQWSWGFYAGSEPDFYRVSVRDVDSTDDSTVHEVPHTSSNQLLLDGLSLGHFYKVTLRALERGKNDNTSENVYIRDKKIMEIRVEYSIDELAQLQSIAATHTKRYCKRLNPTMPIDYLHRCKPREYFNKVYNENGGVEQTYRKDENGDRANHINGQLDGLFFSASVDSNPNSDGFGLPLTSSPFGDTRLLLPAWYFLNADSRLYFADFYCMNENTSHWVTLVNTRRGSMGDYFCSEKLLELDIYDNPYLSYKDGVFQVTTGVVIEVLHTEDIDHYSLHLYGGRYEQLASRKPRHGGLYKNPHCKICNM